MNWADSAVLSAAILAAVNIIDSHLITKRMPSLQAFLIPAGIIAIIYGGIMISLFPPPQDIGATPLLIAIASSILRGIGILLFLYVMQTEEVSRVIPVVSIHPVFVAIMAVPLLGETLAYLEWIAIIITVAGAVLISTKLDWGSVPRWVGKSLFLPLTASILLATANLTSKYAMEYISFWNMYAIGALGMALVFLTASLRPVAFRQLRSLRRPVPTMSLLVCNETLAPIAALLLFWSIERGPVSLVSAITGAQPVFVFIYALILSRLSSVLLEQRIGRGTMALRFAAIGMIVGGITIIHLV